MYLETANIVKYQQIIEDLKEVKERVEESKTDKIRFKIETKHWYGYSEPFMATTKDTLKIDKESAKVLLDMSIKSIQETIDRLIDREVDRAIEKRKEQKNEQSR